jgi:hypothetical protein
MADRGIIFTAENARAIQLRQKTQTRRLTTVGGRPSVWVTAQPGDWLWVREPWRPLAFRATGMGPALYQADRPEDTALFRPGRHMPKAMSRMTLVVEEVWIERLQDITEADALAEGAFPPPAGTDDDGAPYGAGTFRDGFRELWESIHGASWADNPEVVRIAFRMVLANIDSMEPAYA